MPRPACPDGALLFLTSMLLHDRSAHGISSGIYWGTPRNGFIPEDFVYMLYAGKLGRTVMFSREGSR